MALYGYHYGFASGSTGYTRHWHSLHCLLSVVGVIPVGYCIVHIKSSIFPQNPFTASIQESYLTPSLPYRYVNLVLFCKSIRESTVPGLRDCGECCLIMAVKEFDFAIIVKLI